MLPGGMMPVTQLIAMIRSSPPKSAAGLLMAMPAERLPVVTAAMRPADLVRLVPALKPEARRGFIQSLGPKHLFEVIRGMPLDEAAVLLPVVPTERLGPVVAGLSDGALAALLDGLPPDQRQRVESVADPRREQRVLGLAYGDAVARALARGNVQVVWQDDGLLVTKARWRIAVAARHGDDGRVAVRDAEDTAYKLRADGALAVTDVPATDDVLRYCKEARADGRPLETVTWVDDRHDGHLIRTLVSLFQ
ncbi:magnesium transporter MgtE N-terminal domain-containing protein [Dactylosporangium sp. NPDC048998]|uniref:magnesium transporter MgtE N-terminal domain-containing protein n=1 Tax=Dactylosporangium sp. NPDC048998 TaxID=3363976 RepID=UPI003721685E